MLFNIIALWLICSWMLLFLAGRREFLATWREPVLRRPVLIIESDDWGAGPASQADALGDIAHLLAGFSDGEGNPPVMTLGMVLASADGEQTVASGHYQRQLISPATHKALLNVIHEGIASGVFYAQLHGMEHFWPHALMVASHTDASVKSWLLRAPEAATEELPSPLQSRWVDASVLPARPLSRVAIDNAVREEVDAFQAVFGGIPHVVVPSTFIWNQDVEQAWAGAGVQVVVTPGRRFEARDAQGRPAAAGHPVYNGQRGEGGTVYLVRDIYFEPALGHTAAQALQAFDLKTKRGRPALFETHRFNFLGWEDQRAKALAELRELISGVVKNNPRIAFLSTHNLAEIFLDRDPRWVEQNLGRRLHVWLSRLSDFNRLRKLAWFTGWIVPAWLAWKLTG